MIINYSFSKIEAGDNGSLEDLNAKDLNAKLPNEENVNLPESTESWMNLHLKLIYYENIY